MSTEVFNNFLQTTLSAAVNSSTTSIPLASTTGWKTSGQFRILIDDELMLVTDPSANPWVVTRGAEGTTAASHDSAAEVSAVLTDESLQTLAEQVFDGSSADVYATFPGNAIAIPATATTLGAGLSAHVGASVGYQQTSDATPTDIVTYEPPANSSHRFSVTIVARNEANTGDEYSADFSFHLSTYSGGSLTPSTPAAINLVTIGAGSTWTVAVTFDGTNLHVTVTGAADTTVNWACALQDVVRL